jgi:hypothetical protein
MTCLISSAERMPDNIRLENIESELYKAEGKPNSINRRYDWPAARLGPMAAPELRGCLSRAAMIRGDGGRHVSRVPAPHLPNGGLDESDRGLDYRIKIKARGVDCLVRIRYTWQAGYRAWGDRRQILEIGVGFYFGTVTANLESS